MASDDQARDKTRDKPQNGVFKGCLTRRQLFPHVAHQPIEVAANQSALLVACGFCH